ncbi:zinc-binding alcohol dehydrogenase [Nonomuraea deserti]|uniref:Zinc-binding alcohol dehydrogenase n=1 Tax=Nonomuraea deserti TaxID=1848322 RepID=A0A4R4W1M8_9ACTN|nr:zinc-binding alcohol dehydrogenase [Nonomuraea deserti]TDD11721.1 zinc-binding alcohol dehydrogenase [Nonomuraea deserti]
MGHLVRFSSPGTVDVVEVEDPSPGPGEILLETAYSGISAGTELTAYRGTNPYLASEWDPARKLFVPGGATKTYPIDAWGYEEVGRVAAVGSAGDEDLVGKLVWGSWGHQSKAVRPVGYARERLLPGVEPMLGVFGRIGAIAFNAILDADIHLGESVVVFGAGVPGQIVAQLARLNGARVTVVDPVAARRALAERLGADETLDPTSDDVAAAVRAATDNRGADVVIEMSGAYQALQEAVRTVGYNSRVVASGFFQGPATPLKLGEEFHHNRVAIICSQISGVAAHLQHRWNDLRMSRTVLSLAHDGKLALDDLVTHVFPAKRASDAFDMLDKNPQDALQVVLDYRETA